MSLFNIYIGASSRKNCASYAICAGDPKSEMVWGTINQQNSDLAIALAIIRIAEYISSQGITPRLAIITNRLSLESKANSAGSREQRMNNPSGVFAQGRKTELDDSRFPWLRIYNLAKGNSWTYGTATAAFDLALARKAKRHAKHQLDQIGSPNYSTTLEVLSQSGDSISWIIPESNDHITLD